VAFRDQLTGTYELVSLEAHRSDGQVTHPFGETPAGTFMFDAAGRFSVQIVDPVAAGEPPVYVGMFGTYTVDDANQTFTLSFLGGHDPAMTGTDTLRHVNFRDGLAVFNPEPVEQDGLVTTTYITWRPVAAA
jgi:hypothetical protein